MIRWKRPKQHDDVHRRTATIGAAPGSIIIDPDAPETTLSLTVYGPDRCTTRTLGNVEEVRPFLQEEGVVWINVEGLGSEAIVQGLGKLFHLHPLALEDAVNVHQRSKVDRYDEHLFVTARVPAEVDGFRTEQVSLFVGKNYVITFLEDPGDCFDPVRRRLRDNEGSIRRRGADYLAYALLDASVDAYFPLLEIFGDRLEELEDEVIAQPSKATVSRIHEAKHDLRILRRAIWPLREAMNQLARDDSQFTTEPTRVYFRDLYDHAIQILDIVETYRELGADLNDLYLSALSNRMNDVMRVLTVIATIFMPLSFVAGLYGMNFDWEASPWNMPELHWAFGYPLALALMAGIAGGMLLFFSRRGWLGGQANLSNWREHESEK